MTIPNGPYAALKVPDFRLFVTARFCITLAIQIQGVVVAWQVYDLTHDPLSLGIIGLAEAIPSIGVSLYAGHIADIVQRKKIILTCLCTLLVCSVALLCFTLDVGSALLQYGVTSIYAVIFLSGVARGFLTPALFAYMPQLIPRELYSNAITWNSTLWETAAIGGPAVGGLLYSFYGIRASYTADVVLMVLGLSLALAITNKALPPESEEQGMLEKIKAGLRFVFSNQIILGAISLDLFAVLFGGAVALLPIFAKDILHAGPVALGLLRAAPSVGALMMAFYITHNPIKKSMGKVLLYCVGGFGICMILFAVSENLWLSLSLLMVSGMFDCVSVIVRGTLLQTLTPENMKGRVSAVNHIFIGSSNEIGMFESGVAARLLGVVRSVIFGGCMTLVSVGSIAAMARSLRNLQRVQ
jgi:MFS family permease